MATAAARSQGKKLGSFDVLREIGQGGMGVVYLARQPALERLVVLKKIRRDLSLDTNIVERFQREARAAAAVHHQNVVAVYDCFTARGDHYIAQEFVDGQDLRTVLGQAGGLAARVAGLIAVEVARGLEEIHARGVVHRDLKPANILIGSGGETKIADFGIAHEGKAKGLTRPGTMLGSVPYMSPEQMLGERIDYRSDLFSFGILLYEMLAGIPPFQESGCDSTDTLLERIQRGRFESPRKYAPKVPRYLVRLIRTCLRPRPSRRVQSATQVRRRLERRLGRISPADCRREIAAYFWGRGVFVESETRTALRPAVQASTGRIAAKLQRWLPATAAAGALLIVLGVAASAFRSVSSPNGRPADAGGVRDRAAASRTLAASIEPQGDRSVPATPEEHPAAGADPSAIAGDAGRGSEPLIISTPARLRIVAHPWAEVRVDDAPPFYTPRAAPLELAPGRHRLVFEHPRHGKAERIIELAAGEQRVIHHRFDQAPQR